MVEQLHANQLEAIYAHRRELLQPVNLLKAKDRVVRRPAHLVLAAALSNDEHAAFSQGKLAVGMVPWLQYQRRSQSRSKL